MEKLGGDPVLLNNSIHNMNHLINSARRSGRCKGIHRSSAHCPNLNAIVMNAHAEEQPRTFDVLNRTVAKVDYNWIGGADMASVLFRKIIKS